MATRIPGHNDSNLISEIDENELEELRIVNMVSLWAIDTAMGRMLPAPFRDRSVRITAELLSVAFT